MRLPSAILRVEVRFGVRLHAYVLIDNHFHLLLETPEANLSRSPIADMPGMGRYWRGCVPSR